MKEAVNKFNEAKELEVREASVQTKEREFDFEKTTKDRGVGVIKDLTKRIGWSHDARRRNSRRVKVIEVLTFLSTVQHTSQSS